MYFQKKGITKIRLLMPIGPLGELGSKIARKHAPTFKISIVGEEKFDVKAPDVTTQLAKLRTLNPQAIVAFTTGEPAALLARNMAQMGMKIPLVVSHGNANPGFLKLVAQTPTTVIVPAGKIMARDPRRKRPDQEGDHGILQGVSGEVRRTGQLLFGQQADAVALIAEGFEVTKSDDPVKLRDAIEEIPRTLRDATGCTTCPPRTTRARAWKT